MITYIDKFFNIAQGTYFVTIIKSIFPSYTLSLTLYHTIQNFNDVKGEQEDHDGPISLTWELRSTG